MDLVVVAPPHAHSREVALLGQVGHHALGGALGDADQRGNVA